MSSYPEYCFCFNEPLRALINQVSELTFDQPVGSWSCLAIASISRPDRHRAPGDCLVV